MANKIISLYELVPKTGESIDIHTYTLIILNCPKLETKKSPDY